MMKGTPMRNVPDILDVVARRMLPDVLGDRFRSRRRRRGLALRLRVCPACYDSMSYWPGGPCVDGDPSEPESCRWSVEPSGWGCQCGRFEADAGAEGATE